MARACWSVPSATRPPMRRTPRDADRSTFGVATCVLSDATGLGGAFGEVGCHGMVGVMVGVATTVLVADDDADLRLLVRVVLERAGFDVVEEAIDGEATIEAVTRLDPPPTPTVM